MSKDYWEVLKANTRLKLFAITKGWEFPGGTKLLEMFPLEDM